MLPKTKQKKQVMKPVLTALTSLLPSPALICSVCVWHFSQWCRMTEGPGVLERGLTLVKGQVKHDDVRGPDKLLLFKRIFFF